MVFDARKGRLILILIIGIAYNSYTNFAYSASVKDGDTCSPIGAVFKQSNVIFNCRASGQSSVWRKTTPKSTPTNLFVMPRVVGMNLQFAQDLLSRQGNYSSEPQDSSGESRFIIIESNWKVCKQSVAAGKRISMLHPIILNAVKLAEVCP
jgi:hypothetical protein